MNAEDTLHKRETGARETGPDRDDPVRESIQDWAEKLKTVDGLREAERKSRETAAALDDLHRLRALGMEAAERNDRQARGLMPAGERENAYPGDTGLRFVKIARAVRQIVVLEQEIMGLRPAPARRAAASAGTAKETGAPEAGPSPSQPEAPGPHPRVEPGAGSLPQASERHERERRDPDDYDDYDDTDDYSDAPIGQVIAQMHAALKAIIDRNTRDRPDEPADDPAKTGERPGFEPEGRSSPQTAQETAGGGAAQRERGPP
jgi:hypothetical protein